MVLTNLVKYYVNECTNCTNGSYSGKHRKYQTERLLVIWTLAGQIYNTRQKKARLPVLAMCIKSVLCNNSIGFWCELYLDNISL